MINDNTKAIIGCVTDSYGNKLKGVIVLLEKINTNCTTQLISSCQTNDYGEYCFYIDDTYHDYKLKFFYNNLDHKYLT